MDISQLTDLVDKFHYIQAKISKYLKNNQYVYLRVFESWQESYNSLAKQLNADKTLTVPTFKLGPFDYSPSGKSIKKTSVEKFYKTINHQVIRLEEKLEALNKAVEEKLIASRPLEKFFQRDADGALIKPLQSDSRVFVAIPAGDADQELFTQGIQPALESQGFSFFKTNRARLDDLALCEIAQELYACRLAIFNLTDQTPNVMLALGLAYGIGKPVIILQHQTEVTLGEVNNDGYIRYDTEQDLETSLRAVLQHPEC